MTKFTDRVITFLGGVPGTDADKHTREAYKDGYNDGNDDPSSGEIAAGGFGYRRGGTSGAREASTSPEENLKTAWELAQSNPIAKRVEEIKRDYIWGSGPAIQTDSQELEKIANKFKRGNKLMTRGSQIVRQWVRYGEQVITAFVRKTDGRVLLGYIDPTQIDEVIPHPENAIEMWAVAVKEHQSTRNWETSHGKRVYRIVRTAEGAVYSPNDVIVPAKRNHGANVCPACGALNRLSVERCEYCHTSMSKLAGREIVIEQQYEGRLTTAAQTTLQPWEHVMLESFGLVEYTGDCFYLQKNADVNQTRGTSDHLQQADTIDQHDQTLHALGEREQLSNLVYVDVTVKGNAQDVADERKKWVNNPPRPGSAHIHNDSITANMNSPSLNQTASVETARAMLANACGGYGIPRAWYGEGDMTNRATLQGQSDPTWRTLQHDQGVIAEFVTDLLEFARDQAFIAGEVGVTGDEVVTVTMPEMIARDMAMIVGSIANLISSLSMALTAATPLIDYKSAVNAVSKVMSELDIEINTEALLEEDENEGATERLNRAVNDALPEVPPVSFGGLGGGRR